MLRMHGVSKSKCTVSMAWANQNIPYPWYEQIKMYLIHGV